MTSKSKSTVSMRIPDDLGPNITLDEQNRLFDFLGSRFGWSRDRSDNVDGIFLHTDFGLYRANPGDWIFIKDGTIKVWSKGVLSLTTGWTETRRNKI